MAGRSTYISNVVQLLFDFPMLYYQNDIQRITKGKISLTSLVKALKDSDILWHVNANKTVSGHTIVV